LILTHFEASVGGELFDIIRGTKEITNATLHKTRNC